LPVAPPTESLLRGVGPPAQPGDEGVWLLGTGSPVHYDAGTLTRFAGWARVMEPVAQVAVGRGLAQKLGLEPGDDVRLRAEAREAMLECTVRDDLSEEVVVASGNFSEVRALFGWAVPSEGDLLPSGPVTVAVEATNPVTTASEQG